MSHSVKKAIDTIRMGEPEKAAIVSQMNRDTKGRHGGKFDRRLRLPFQGGDLDVEVQHPNGTLALLLMRPRNLSTHGISLLAGTYLHVDTRCEITMLTLDGERLRVTGKVSFCHHFSGKLHEVRMLFEHPIEIENFVDIPDEFLDVHAKRIKRDAVDAAEAEAAEDAA